MEGLKFYWKVLRILRIIKKHGGRVPIEEVERRVGRISDDMLTFICKLPGDMNWIDDEFSPYDEHTVPTARRAVWKLIWNSLRIPLPLRDCFDVAALCITLAAIISKCSNAD